MFFSLQELSDKLGAVAAFDALVGTASMQTEETKKTFSKHLSNTLCTSTNYDLLEQVLLMKRDGTAAAAAVQNDVSAQCTFWHRLGWHVKRLNSCKSTSRAVYYYTVGSK